MKPAHELPSLHVAPRLRPTFAIWSTACFGVAAAVAIAQESWAALGGLSAIPMALVAPIQFAFGLLSLAVPFDTVTFGESTFTTSFLVTAGAGAILLTKLLGERCFATPPRAAKWVVLFFVWTIMSTFWALNSDLSTLRLPAALSLAVLYLVAVNTRVSDQEFHWIGILAVAGGALAALVSIYQFARGMNVAGRASIVFGAIATNSNELAASLIFPLSLAIGLTLSTRGPRRLLVAIAAILILACTLLTMSRGALVAVAVLAVVYFYRRGVDKTLLALLICTLFLIAMAPDLLRTRMHESLTSRAQGRWDIWLVGMEVVKHHGLFGVGLDNFPIAFQRYAGRQEVFRTFSVVPHNIYLQALTETGVLGLFLLFAMLRAQIREIASAVRNSPPVWRNMLISYEAAAWAILTHALVANLLWRKVFWFSWILLAIAVQAGSRSTVQPQPVTAEMTQRQKRRAVLCSPRTIPGPFQG